MKTFFYVWFSVLFLSGCFAAFQGNGQTPKSEDQLKSRSSLVPEAPASLNVVPEWVREKVTPEEYEMFKLISTRFRVDYSFLREDISDKRRVLLNGRWETLCREINSGRYPEGSSWVYSVASEPKKASFKAWELKSLESSGIDENEESRAKVMGVYTGLSNDVYLNASVTYVYNTKTGVVSDISISINALSSVPNRNPDFSGGCRADYNTGLKKIQGVCTGSLAYTINNSNQIETIQNLQFLFEP